MRTVFEVKQAMDFDTMVNIMREGQEERRQTRRHKEAAKLERKPTYRPTKWEDLFPACVCR